MEGIEDNKEGILVVAVTLSVIITHYVFPLIHYCCIGACYKQRSGDVFHGNIASTSVNTDNQDELSEEESKAIYKIKNIINRVFSIHCTFWAYAWITLFAVTSTVSTEENQPTYLLLFKIFGYIHLPIFILFLWIEAFSSVEYQYLDYKLEDKTCRAYIHDLIKQQPVVTISIVAYHYETKTERVELTDVFGGSYTRTFTKEKKVIDLTNIENFQFCRWEDLSPSTDTLTLDAGKVTRIKMLKQIILGNDETQAEFSRLRSDMEAKARRMHPKSIIELDRNDDIPGYQEKVCAYWETSNAFWWINKGLFIILSLLLMSGIYRIIFSSQFTCVRVVKKIYSF